MSQKRCYLPALIGRSNSKSLKSLKPIKSSSLLEKIISDLVINFHTTNLVLKEVNFLQNKPKQLLQTMLYLYFFIIITVNVWQCNSGMVGIKTKK